MTQIVGVARAVALLQRGPASVQRIAAVTRVSESAVKGWVKSLQAAGLIRAAGVEQNGARGIKATQWEWVG